jgi:putative purine nucleoside phosphorylase
MILSNFDDAKKAIINPEDLVAAITDFPEIVVSCFARATFKRMLKRYKHRLLTKTSVANLDIPIYELDYHGRKLAVFNAYVGAAGCVGRFGRPSCHGNEEADSFWNMWYFGGTG